MKKRNSLQSSMFFSHGSKKRASEKYYIIISLILGLIVLSISLYFIFKEYFTEDELNWEICRQSIYLRSISPDFHKITDLKDALPLKCKTEVVNINSAKNPEEVYKKISDSVAAGWYLFGEGEYDIVPRKLLEETTYCMIFARIGYTENALNDIENNYNDWIKYLRTRYGNEVDIYPVDIMLQKGFINYYRSNNKLSREKYDDYLKIYTNNEDLSDSGNLFVDWSNFDLTKNNNYLLIYQRSKIKGLLSDNLLGFLTKIVPSFASKVLWTDEEVKKFDVEKLIIITTPENLQNIGCDEFLTIPA